MENLKVKLASGADLEVTLASFSEGHRLFKAVTRVLTGFDLSEGTVQKLSMLLLSSEEVEAALWPCMERAVYKTLECPAGLKINKALFEKAEAREDFLEISEEVLGYNLTPFSKSIGSLSKVIHQKSIVTQALK